MDLERIKRIAKGVLFDEGRRFLYFNKLGLYDNMPDDEFLKKMFYYKMGYELNLEHPKTFNEKLQWLKIYNRNPRYTSLVDKYRVKEYIAKNVSEELVIPTLGVWDKFEDIDFDMLPEQFVLKCTHDSGGIVIVRDKSKFDKRAAKKKIEQCLKRNFFLYAREWPYKNVEPKIIAEKYMKDGTSNSEEITDYKFFCVDGYVDNVMVCLERSTGEPKFYFFDKEWNLLRINKRGKEAEENFSIPKPVCMDEMFALAEKLTKGIPFVRVDLYECNKKIYFGEFTFYPSSGFDANLLPETDEYFGELINLEGIKERKER